MEPANSAVWLHTVLNQAFPGHVIKDVGSGELPEWYIQQHEMMSSFDEPDAESVLSISRRSFRLRVYAPTSYEAAQHASRALDAVQQAVENQVTAGGLTGWSFSLWQGPVENFKVTSIKATIGAQVDCSFSVKFIHTYDELFGRG
jgi:hypothetical protein